MKKKIVNLGLIGLGGQGEKIASAILACKNLKLVACCHFEKEIADDYAKKYGCLAFISFKKMLQNPLVEAVVIATPNYLHYSQMKLCIAAKKHIFVEKPMTNNCKEAKEIVKQCNASKLVLMVGHNFRREGAIRKMKELIDKGKIGKFVSAEINISHSGGLKFTKDNWRFYQKKCPGGPLIMLGSHAIDTSNYLFGEAKKVAAFIKKLYASTQTPDTSIILAELKSGGLAYICNNYNMPGTHFVKAYGTKGILYFDKNQGVLSFQGEDIDKNPCSLKSIQYKQVNTLQEELEEFGTCILKGKAPETDATAALQVLSVIEAAEESQKKNKFIAVKSF